MKKKTKNISIIVYLDMIVLSSTRTFVFEVKRDRKSYQNISIDLNQINCFVSRLFVFIEIILYFLDQQDKFFVDKFQREFSRWKKETVTLKERFSMMTSMILLGKFYLNVYSIVNIKKRVILREFFLFEKCKIYQHNLINSEAFDYLEEG
jgi:hypothetical protein